VKTLRDEKQKRIEQDEVNAVDTAFATYKDSRNLTDASKKQMLLTYRHDRALFDELYPIVQPDQRHLLRNVAPVGARPGTPQHDAPPVTVDNITTLATKLMRDNGYDRATATAMATRQLSANSRTMP
jgi:hypothetical protein